LGRATIPGDVLYMYLEGPRDLPGQRIRQLGCTGERGKVFFHRKTMQTSTLSEGLAQLLPAIEAHPNTRLLIIDTLQKFLRLQDSDKYDETVKAMEWLETGLCSVVRTRLG